MKKRKQAHDSASQLKISKYFCKTIESNTSKKEFPHVENSKFGPSQTNNNVKRPRYDCFDEKSPLGNANSDVMKRNSVKYAKLDISSNGTVLHKTLNPLILSKTTVIIEELAATAMKPSKDVGGRNTVVDCSSEIASSSNELDCDRSVDFLRSKKEAGNTSTSNRSCARLRTESCSKYCLIDDIDRGCGNILIEQDGRKLVHSQDSSKLPIDFCSVHSETSQNVLAIDENGPKLRVTEDSAMSEKPNSLKNEAKCSSCQEEDFDISMEEWDLGVCDQLADDNIYDLQLSEPERCRVVSVSGGPVENSKLLVVTSTRCKDMAKVLLLGIWASACRVSAGDVVSIQCSRRDEERGWWVLDDSSAAQACLTTNGSDGLLSKLGFLVENPDVLVPSTSVVGSLFCARKGVLSDRFRGFEMAGIPAPLASPCPPHATATTTSPEIASNGQQSSGARVMLIGSLVHEALQKSLSGGLRKPFEIGQVCHEVVNERKAIWDMYAAGADLAEVRKEVMGFVPRIVRFMERFVAGGDGRGVPWRGDENVDAGREWQGRIGEVRDIEECLWVPSLGLKGKVDATVGVWKPGGVGGALPLKEVPLELKTGKGSYSAEHQGQVLLYCAMMSTLGTAQSPSRKTVSSGLLLYLRDESMREIHASRHALRDLILLRNDVVHYVMGGPGIVEGDMDQSGRCGEHISLTPPVLPAPIRHKRACSNCPYLTICSAHLKCDNGLEAIPVDHPMALLAPQALKHLSPTHLNYFIRWSCLVGLEHAECMQKSTDHLLWTIDPWEREKMGKCISNLLVKEVRCALDEEQGLFSGERSLRGLVHCFVRGATLGAKESALRLPGGSGDFPHLPRATFDVGERVLVSWGDRVAVSSGAVVSSGGDMLCICIGRDLTQRYGSGRFHVDKYEYVSTVSSFSLTSLGLLLTDTWSANRLRQLIIDRKAPKFLKKLSGEVVSKCSSILKGLNKSQVRAVLSAMAAQDFLLIRGLPGTGKSATIVAMVRAFVSAGRSVLVTGHTHTSVDNVMSRLVEEGDLGDLLVRLGSLQAVDSRLWPYCESTLVANCRTPKEISEVFLSKAVVGVTCMGCGTHPLINTRAFDICILDEAGQVLLPVSLRPILSSSVFILVGDPEQLPPVVRSHQARDLGLQQTLFNALDFPEACVTLDLQYRMNSEITRLANNLSYGSRLICANEQVANAVLHLPGQERLADTYSEDTWLHEVLSSKLERSVVIINTGDTLHVSKEDYYPKDIGVKDMSNEETLHKYANVCEAGLTHYLVKALLEGGAKATDIGVIAPYTDQVCLLRSVLGDLGGIRDCAVDVSTVDQFQGRDKEVIIYSFTRSGSISAAEASKTKDLQLLSNKHRLTVAVTRAKRKLICIGHLDVLGTYSVLRDFISLVSENNVVDVCGDGSGFSWARIFKGLLIST